MKDIKLTTKEFIERAKLKHGNKYNYSLVKYDGAKIKVKIICSIHGEFNQIATNHLSGSGCPKCCGNIKLTKKQFIEKAKSIHFNKYDYSLIDYINTNKKIKIICPIHEEFEQKAANHLRGDNCPSCTKNKRLIKEEFIKRAKLKHGDKYDYSLVNYFNNSKKVKIICPKHDIFNQNPNNHINGNGCPRCKESKGEIEIRDYLIKNKIEYISQHRFKDCKDILPLPFDFYLPELNICIEFNGRQHYTPINIWGGIDELKKIQYRDKIKKEYCNKNKIILLIIRYNENVIIKLNKLINPKT